MGETIGFIGLGTMGFPMMSQLAKAGVKIVAYDTESSVLRRAAEVPGVQAAAHPREATHCSTVVFTCLPNDQIVNNVYMGKDGILEAAREGLITCDCSTVFPDTTLALAAALRRKGTIHMDTTMLGSKPQAETGEVFFIVGGDETALPRIKPAIDIMGRMHIYAGPSGSANKVKLIHNALGNLNYAAAAEALALAIQSGVDPQIFHQVVKNGGGQAYSRAFDVKGGMMLAGNFAPRFKLSLAAKDSRLAMQLAQQYGIATPLLTIAQQHMQEAEAAGYGDLDAAAVCKLVERRMGRTLSGK
ncbi:MAG TPA: NAD(P)-dependent oxidoreductase [Geobacteraceae bacterium]|nr:NAD(P)-dependent oxidoreductase [Geobacteraceae bacterium]